MALDLWAREPGIHALQLAEEHRLALGRQAEQRHRDYGNTMVALDPQAPLQKRSCSSRRRHQRDADNVVRHHLRPMHLFRQVRTKTGAVGKALVFVTLLTASTPY